MLLTSRADAVGSWPVQQGRLTAARLGSGAYASRQGKSSSAYPYIDSRQVVCLAQLQPDPYVAAGVRLQSLINGVGDGEDEMYYNMLLEEAPAQKLQVNAALGAAVLTASSIICWLCGKDPAGGASLSLHSLQSAAIGAAAAVPLVLYKHDGWQPETQSLNPTLSALQKAQIENAKPWLLGMDSNQLALHLVLDTLPALFLMLPAAQGGLTSSFEFTSSAIASATGVDLPQELGIVVALLMTALVTGAVRSTDYMADPEQLQVVNDAVANADRYYRLMASSSSSSTDSSSHFSQEQEAARAAMAFKAVAVCWREQEQEMMRLSMTHQVVDFMYLGALWYLSGDMTAPCVAALLANAVDYHFMWRGLNANGAGGSGSGGRGGRGSKRAHKKSS